ncbi:MAG: hypothetical protein UHD09_00875 [Bifidobacterium sp.]|nr:hypothetical protein [Bifidobacterium sp.]
MNNPMVTDALLDGRSVIVVGPAPLADKVTVFGDLINQVADDRYLAVIDDKKGLDPALVPAGALTIDADGVGADAIHRQMREAGVTAVAFPGLRRGDVVRMLMDFAGQENGQVIMLNEGTSDAKATLDNDLPMLLLRTSPSGHTEFSDAAIKAMDPVLLTLDDNGNVESLLTVDLGADGLKLVPMQ